MKTKQEIVENWLPRYTQRPVEEFTKHILLTNFSKYVEIFASHFNVPILGEDSNMPSASAEGITIINFGMGSANAATIMDLLSAVAPEAVLFLGKCGGIKKVNKLGDYILPIAAITGRGYLERLFPARGASSAGLHVAAGRIDSRAEPSPRLLDGDRVYDQPTGMGV